MSHIDAIAKHFTGRPDVRLDGDHLRFRWGAATIGTDGVTWIGFVVPSWVGAAVLKVNGLQTITPGDDVNSCMASLLMNIRVIDDWYERCNGKRVEKEALKLASFVRFLRREVRQHLGQTSTSHRSPTLLGISVSALVGTTPDDELLIMEKLVALAARKWMNNHGTEFTLTTHVDSDIIDVRRLIFTATPHWNCASDELEALIEAVAVTHLKMHA